MRQTTRILIVDDEPSNLLLLVNILEPYYQVLVAKNGRDALDQASTLPTPDLILLDIQLPDISGIDVLQTLKLQPTTNQIPVIFITSLTQAQDESRGFEVGGSDYITKPIVPDVVLARVKTQLKRERDRKNVLKSHELLERDLLLSQTVGEIGSWKMNLSNPVLVGTAEFYRLLGADPNIPLDREQFLSLVHQQHRDQLSAAWESLLTGNTCDIEFRTCTEYPETWLHIVSHMDHNGDGSVARGIVQNITKKKQYEAALENLAYRDPLTGLPNQYSLDTWLREQYQENGVSKCILFQLDLDNLSRINTQLGIDQGDLVIRIIAGRLREYAKPGTFVSHHGGDQFMISMCIFDEDFDQRTYAQQLQSIVQDPIVLGQDQIVISACIGVVSCTNTEYGYGILLRMANYAGYLAKIKGKGSYAEYNVSEHREDLATQRSINQLRIALEQEQFVLYYQPKINLITNQILGFEALIRWNHPQHGIQSPGTFIPIIESHPLIVQFGDYVISHALSQQACWRSQGMFLPISVNIATVQYEHPEFIEKLTRQLSKHRGRSDLELEILESGPGVHNLTRAVEIINNIKKLHISVSLDDFGVGHSSLQTLRAFKPNNIKIDKSFVLKITSCEVSSKIVQAILALGDAFDIPIIAEGIETPEHWQCLENLGCVYGQGYAISKPMPADQVIEWCNNWNQEYGINLSVKHKPPRRDA